MNNSQLEQIVTRFTSEDPLGTQELGVGNWQVHRLDARRYSTIYSLRPGTHAHCLVSRAGSDELILKVYHAALPDRRQQEFDDLCRVYEAMSIHNGCGIVRPITCYADWGALITVRAPGTPGGDIVRGACRKNASAEILAKAASLCSQSGHWLKLFQQRGHKEYRAGLPTHWSDRRSFLSYLDERLIILCDVSLGINRGERQEVLDMVESILEERPSLFEGGATWSHSDFGPHNVLLQDLQVHSDRPRITVLDFELKRQHEYFDAAYFIESIAIHDTPWNDQEHIKRLSAAFLAGWGAPNDPGLLNVFRLRHLLCTYISQGRRKGAARWLALPGIWNLRRRFRQLKSELKNGLAKPLQPNRTTPSRRRHSATAAF